MSPYEKLYDVEPKEIEVEERGRTEYIAAV
jgi:hypothetical protein